MTEKKRMEGLYRGCQASTFVRAQYCLLTVLVFLLSAMPDNTNTMLPSILSRKRRIKGDDIPVKPLHSGVTPSMASDLCSVIEEHALESGPGGVSLLLLKLSLLTQGVKHQMGGHQRMMSGWAQLFAKSVVLFLTRS
ncbi:MAG: hypothetical protein KKB70_04305 [Proteobacteria bacterium]|nr:hypothetical protein [Pseudomonadota bacterium]MBU1612367.1 hypothetical protein [Pseudomonadota bacterium]